MKGFTIISKHPARGRGSLIFTNKSMIYYRDSNDLIELINYYLVSSDGRKKSMEIANRARKIAKLNTWTSRLDKIKDFFEE